jgi:succinate dehydrogenase / fumarate reductase cytochrome b subunit
MEKIVGVKGQGLGFLVERWLLPFKRSLGTWAFVFNRWSGILLVIYLYAHLAVLTPIAFQPNAYDRFLEIARSPLGLLFDVGLVLLLLYHGLNGLRIIYVTLIGKIEPERGLFWAVVAASLAVTVYSAFVFFSLEGG